MDQLSIQLIVPFGVRGITRSQCHASYSVSDRAKSAFRAHLSGDINTASTLYDEEIACKSNNPQIYSNRAAIWYANNEYSLALRLLERAHSLQDAPSYTSYLVSHCSLLTSNYGKAWRFYEYRWLNNYIPDINIKLPACDPAPLCSVDKRKYIVHQDGGLGDLVFILNLFLESDLLDNIIYVGDPRSCSLLSALKPNITTISYLTYLQTTKSGMYEGWIPIQSLMRIGESPLVNGLAKQQTRHIRFTSRPCKIGLHWQGNSLNELYLIPGSRSVPLTLFIDLLLDDSLSLYSLQLGQAAQQTNIFKSLFDYLAHIDQNVISSNAAYIELVKSMDMIVCVDSFVANLAGYLRKPTLLILSCHHDWRWVARDAEGFSTLYPTVKILEWRNQITSEELHDSFRTFLSSY